MKQVNNIKDSGFTLIEIIVAVSIFGVIIAIVFPAVLQFLEARDRILEKNSTLFDFQKVQILLENDIRFAHARTFKDEYGAIGKTFIESGDDAIFEFISAAQDPVLGLSSPRRVAWLFEDGKLKRKSYYSADPGRDSPSATITLMDQVESVDVEYQYLDSGRASKTKTWRDKDKQLPNLVTVSIGLENEQTFSKTVSFANTGLSLP